ncbi:MAG: GntR family transcriptional regulator, partial [Spirulina sp. SIO3F2]|nr:GntR family transcriptional regulator [Spirulina sp. SIO3F2]
GILTTTLAPGSDLDEVQLANEFGLSRTPLREVLRELAGPPIAPRSGTILATNLRSGAPEFRRSTGPNSQH